MIGRAACAFHTSSSAVQGWKLSMHGCARISKRQIEAECLSHCSLTQAHSTCQGHNQGAQMYTVQYGMCIGAQMRSRLRECMCTHPHTCAYVHAAVFPMWEEVAVPIAQAGTSFLGILDADGAMCCVRSQRTAAVPGTDHKLARIRSAAARMDTWCCSWRVRVVICHMRPRQCQCHFPVSSPASSLAEFWVAASTC